MEHGLIAPKGDRDVACALSGNSPRCSSDWVAAEENFAGRTDLEVCVPSQRRLRRASLYRRLLRDPFGFLFVNKIRRSDILCRDTH